MWEKRKDSPVRQEVNPFFFFWQKNLKNLFQIFISFQEYNLFRKRRR